MKVATILGTFFFLFLLLFFVVLFIGLLWFLLEVSNRSEILVKLCQVADLGSLEISKIT